MVNKKSTAHKHVICFCGYSGLLYDLSELRGNDKVYGPVVDINNHKVWFVCLLVKFKKSDLYLFMFCLHFFVVCLLLVFE